VAEETMRRARANVELLIERLRAAGYEFQYPEAMHVRPTDAEIARLDTLESELGPLPLSLRIFYELVGTVDLTQSWDQSSSGRRNGVRRRASWKYSVSSIRCRRAAYLGWERRDVSPELVLHRAGRVSQGELERRRELPRRLPDSAADFPIQGMSGVDELFVPYLRATLANGGFRGKIECEGENCWKVEPGLELTRTLAVGLTPM
jgi:hypothetical protein